MTLPRVCIVGPLVGLNPGHVITQGERLTELLRAAGYDVTAVSSSLYRGVRFTEIVSTIIRHHKRIDVLVMFTYGQLSFVIEDVASALAKKLEIPMVMALCGGALPEFIERFPRWTRRVFDRANAFVCQSGYLATEMKRLGYQSRVINNMIDLAKYEHRVRTAVRPKLFWMRAFEDAYNPVMALDVLHLLRKRYSDATLVMAGQDSGDQARVEARARSMGLGDVVKFPGFLDLAGKTREANAADIFINTPRIDNRPICVVEAGAFGLPIVTTSVGGIPYLVEDRVTALLVPDNDVAAMAAAIELLVDDPAVANGLSINGRTIAEQSASTSVLPKWEEVLNQATQDHT